MASTHLPLGRTQPASTFWCSQNRSLIPPKQVSPRIPQAHSDPFALFPQLSPQKARTRGSAPAFTGEKKRHTPTAQARVGFPAVKAAIGTETVARAVTVPGGVTSPGQSPLLAARTSPLDAQDTSDRRGHRGLCKKKKHQVITAAPWLQLPACLSPLLHWRSEAKIALTGIKWLPASQTIRAKLAWKSLYHAMTNLIFPVVKTACLVPYPLSHITPIPVSQTCHIQPTLCVFGHQATRPACSLCSPRCVTSSLAFRAQIKSYF